MQDGGHTPLKEQIAQSPDFPRIGIPRGDGNAQTLTPQDAYDNMMSRLNGMSDKTTPSSAIPIMPGQIDTSGRYPKQIVGADNEELYAEGQSSLSKFGHAFTKMLGTAASTFLQGTLGMAAGAAEWAETGDLSKIWDNQFNRDLTNRVNNLENKLPNYYTHKEIDSKWYSGDNLLTANFWFDKVMKNLGFSLGAAAGGFAWGAALKAIGLTGTLVKAGANMEEFAAGMENTLARTPQIERGTAAMQYMSNAVKNTAKVAGGLLTRSDRALTAAMGTFGESAMESIQNSSQYRENAIDEYKKSHYGQEPTGADLDEINKGADHVGNWSFGLNSILLTGTNYIQFPRILNMSGKAESAMVNEVESQPLRQVGGKFISALPEGGFAKKLFQAKNIAGLLFNPIEGFEEGAQNVIQEGTQDFFKKAKEGGDTSFWQSLGVGVDRTINTKNGIEQILIGGLSGALQTSGIIPFHRIPVVNKVFGGESFIKERGITGYGGDRRIATEQALQALNKTTLANSIKDNVDSFNRSQVIQEERERAVRQGDIMETKDKEFDFVHNYLYPRIKYGKFDFVKGDLDTYKNLASIPEQFDRLQMEGYATKLDTPETFIQRLNNIEEHAKTVKQLYEDHNVKYGGYVDKEGKKIYSPEVIDKMVYARSKISDYDNRIPAVSTELVRRGISAQPAIDSVYEQGRPSEGATRDALAQINNLSVTNGEKNDLKRDLQDALEMALRRKEYIKDYNRILGSPENYKDANYTLEEVNISTLNIKQGKERNIDKTITIGQQYALKNPILRDENTLTPNPKLTVMSQTLGGEFEVKMPNGQSKFLTKQQLENYQISDTANDNKKINDILNRAVDKTLALAKYKDIKVPDGEDKIGYINSLDNKELIDDVLDKANTEFKELIAKRQKEEEELKALQEKKDLLDKLFKAQQNTSINTGNVADTNVVIKSEQDSDESKKKAVNIVASSTTSASEKNEPDNVVPPRVVRERNFLFNHSSFPDSVRTTLKALVFTQSSEESLGLKGTTQKTYLEDPENGNYKIDDEDDGVVMVVYVSDRNGHYHFVDEDGKLIGEVGSKVDTNKVVLSTMPTTSTTWRDGKNRFRKEDQEQAENIMNQWKEKRKALFTSKSATPFDFTVSRGLPIYDSYEEDGQTKYRENSPTGTLYSKKEAKKILLSEGVIKVADTDRVTHQGITYPSELGRIYFQFHDKFAPLVNRKFSEEEQNALYDIILQLSKEKGQAERLRNYLRNVLYFSNSAGAVVGRNQIWVDNTGFLNLGTQGQKIAFTPTSIEENQALVRAFLAGVYNNINNQTLKNLPNSPFEEILGINPDGTYKTREWPNYQTFLMDDEFEGKQRNSFLKTPIRKISDSVPNDRNFQQKYAILQGLEYKTIEAPKAEVKKELPATPTAKVESFTTSQGESLSYTRDNLGNINLNKEGDYQKAIDRIAQVPIVKEQIDLGVEKEIAAKVFLETAIKSKLSTPAPKVEEKNIPDIEAKKADIERRRQKELRENVTKKGPLDLSTLEGKADEFRTVAMLGRIEEEQKAINDKYDAELAALEGKKEESQKPNPKLSTPKDEEPEFRRVGDLFVESMSDLEKRDFKDWVEKNLPQFKVEEVEQLLKTANNRSAWGKLQRDVITLYKGAEKGTGHHEAFEAVWKYFVTPEQQSSIYSEVKDRPGTFKDRETQQELAYPDATEKQIKEKLADEFADYKTGKKTSIGQRIRDFFDRIIKFFRSFLRGYKTNPSLVDNLFSQIEKGEFKTYTLPKYLDNTQEFSVVPGLTVAQTNGYVNDISARFMFKLLREGADLFEPETYLDRGDIFSSIKEKYKDEIPSFPNGEATFDDLVQKTKEYLVPDNIQFDENNEISINDENAERTSYNSSEEKMKVDVRKTQPSAIKLFLGTLYKTIARRDAIGNILSVDKEPGVVDNYQLLSRSKTNITLLEALQSSTSPDDMISKLRRLSDENSDYIKLLNRLGNKGNFLDWDKTEAQWRMLSGFYNSFNKQRPEVKGIRFRDGEVYFIGMDLGSSQKQLYRGWENNIRLNARYGNGVFGAYNRKEGLYKIDEAKLAAYKATVKAGKDNTEAMLSFLRDLGIDINRTVYNRLKSVEKDSIGNATNKIFQYLSTKKGLKIIEARTVGISKALNQISQVYARALKPDAESTFLNGDGEQQQTFIPPNYTSYIQNIFNNVSSLDELKSLLPHLQDVYSTNSEILKLGGKFFDLEGNRTGAPLKIGYMNSSEYDGRSKVLKDTDYRQRLEAQLNNILDDTFYISVPADGSTDWFINLPGFVEYTELLSGNKKILDKMFEYLSDEMELADEDRNNISNVGNKSKELRFFKDILSEKNLEIANKIINGELFSFDSYDSVYEDFQNYINKEVDKLKATLRDEDVVSEDQNYRNEWLGLLDEYVEKNKLPKTKALDNEQFNTVVRQIVINDFVANMELHKFLFGDPYNFKVKEDSLDETKRIKSFLSPAQPLFTSTAYNNTFGRLWANTGTITDYTPKDVASSVTLKDVIIDGKLPGYQKNNEADSQAFHSILAHRDILNRTYKLGKKGNAWMNYELAYTRNRLSEKGIDIGAYSEEQKALDKKLLEGKRPEYVMGVLKPIVRGAKSDRNFNDPILDKFSSAPIWYSAVEGTNLEHLFVKMLKEKIDYVIFESGRKVGAEGMHNIYNSDGSFNDEPFNNRINVGWENYSIQTENQYDPQGRQTRGTQITKLFSLDFFEEGKPTDFSGTQDQWNTLSPEEKEKQSEMEKRKNENNKILNELTTDGYERLLGKLGIEDRGDSFAVVKREQLMKTLRDEAFKRDMSDNLRDVFKPNPDTGEYFPFEATSEYTKVQKMLYSMADKHILSPTHNGGQKTQMSAVGWEDAKSGRKLAVKTEEGYREVSRTEYSNMSAEDRRKVVLTSSALKFYSKEHPYMEILLPNWFRNKLNFKDKRTDDELLEYLNSTEEGRKILSGIGFRIPTQGMNQIESFRVKGFLAAEYGDTVVVPSEITTKAGSDFDIDKLNTYLRNVYIDNKGDVKEVPFFGYGIEGKAKLKEWLKADVIQDFLLNEEKAVDNPFENIDFEKEEEKAKKKFDNLYTQSLQNAYIDNLEWFIQHPSNFEKLTQPTEGGPLKSIAKEIAELTGQQSDNKLTNLLSVNYLSKLRQQFMAAKKWIGIVVNGITSHAQAQRTQLYLDIENTKLSRRDKEILGDGKIRLKHNSTIINGRELPTLSKLLDRAGKFISDKLSWYTTAMVDVAKDPYIASIIHNKKLVATFMFLERIGVPTRDVALFMNQPIIREYLRFSDREGFSDLSNPYFWRDNFLSLGMFPNTKGEAELEVEEFPDCIKGFYGKPDIEPGKRLTEQQNRYQNLVLTEFVKYHKMAEHLFNFGQATNWDTADLKTGGSIFKKQLKAIKENKYNIFKTPARILNATGLATIASSIVATRDAIGTLSKFDSPIVRGELDEVLKPYTSLKYQTQTDFEKADNQITSSFIDYLLQTKTGLNKSINKTLIDESSSTAAKIRAIKNDPQQLQALNDNPIFNNLQVQTSPFDNGGDNIYLKPFPKAGYDKDLITGYIREIKELSPDLYGSLVRLALLQGSGKLNNLLPYIPTEDFAKALSPLIQGNLREEAENYRINRNFERSNWKDNSIVPEGKRVRIYVSNETGLQQGRLMSQVPGVIKLTDTYNSDLVQYPVVKLRKTVPINGKPSRFNIITGTVTPAEELNKMKEEKDFSFLHYVGFQKVMMDNGEPFTSTNKDGVVTYYYKPINLMGTGELQEHYGDQRPSVLDNQTVKIDNPSTDAEVIQALNPNKPAPPASSPAPIKEVSTKVEVAPVATEYTNHSGGALGSDSVWEDVGREFGVIDHKHYYSGAKTPRGNTPITKEELEEGWQHVLKANETLKRKPGAYKNLLSRNWFQVKNSDAIFAIGKLNTSKSNVEVQGGTGWAVQMALDAGKPVYFFDQNSKTWAKMSNSFDTLEILPKAPSLTKNFAGIGTREINDAGKQAIRDVYQNTFNKKDGLTPEEGTEGTC